MYNVQALLRQAEIASEKVSASIRVVVFLSLAAVVSSAAGVPGLANPAGMVTAIYGLGALLGLFLAWRRVFHPVIPYMFVTFDVVLVVMQVLMLGRFMGMQPSSPFALPAAALIFVLLIHASMRYRPWLVVYAAVLLVISIELGPLVFPADQQTMMGGMRASTQGHMASLVNYHALRSIRWRTG